MNFTSAQQGWYVVARANDLKRKKPLRVILFQVPLVIFGSPQKPSVLRDQCPHRGAALSEGRKVGDKIQCPYHGWTFDGAGHLAELPCLIGEPPQIRSQPFEVTVSMGLVFVKIGEVDELPYKNAFANSIKFWRALPGGAEATLEDAAENFLDTTHTHSVHKNIFRGKTPRTRTRVLGTATKRQALLEYYGEGDAGGIVGSLLHERERALSVGRFVGPNIAEVEFHGRKGPNFIMTGYFAPIDDEHVAGFGLVGLPGPVWWAWVKFVILSPFIYLVHKQDKNILARISKNRKVGGKFRNIIGPLDFMRPQIDAIVSGKVPPAHHTSFEGELDL